MKIDKWGRSKAPSGTACRSASTNDVNGTIRCDTANACLLLDGRIESQSCGITDPKRKRELLLCQAGARIMAIFKQIPDRGSDNNYEQVNDELREHFEPHKNRRYEVYRFRKRGLKRP